MVCGLGHLVHLGIEEVVTETSILGFGVAIGLKKAGGLDAAQEVFTELGLIQIQVDKAKALESFFWLAVQWQGEEEALKMALLTGQISNTEDLYCNMGELHRRLCQYSFEAMAGILKEFVDGEPYDKGRILGRATFEIAAILVTPEMIAGQVSKLQFIEKLLAAAPKFMKAGQVARLAADLAPVKAALESDAVLVAVKAAGKTNPARELIVSLKLLVEADFAAGKGFRADLYVNYVREAIAKGDEFSGFEIAKGAQDIVVKDLADIAAGKANIELKSYEWWTNRFPSIGDGQGGWEFHHLIENQIWNRLMGFADGTRTSNIPAIPLKGWNKSAADVPYGPFHRGANGVGLSEKINAEVMKVADDAEMLGALKRLYTEPPFGELGMWPATRDWLRANLPNAKKALVPN